MRGLIYKDLLFIKSQWKSLAIMLLGAILISISMGNFLLTICILPLMILSSGITTFQTDEFYNSNTYYIALPLSRKKIVLSKYLFTILLFIISTYIGLVIYLILHYIIGIPYAGCNSDMVKYLFMIEFASLIINSIFYPVVYKFGCEKGKLVLLSIIMLFLGVAAVSSMLIDYQSLMNDISQMESFMTKYGVYILATATTLCYLISYLISCRIIKKKDF